MPTDRSATDQKLSYAGRRVLVVSLGLPVPERAEGAPSELLVVKDLHGVQSAPAASFDLAVIGSTGPAVLDHTMLSAVAARVAPAGRCEVFELGCETSARLGRAPRVSALRTSDELRKAALFAGLTVDQDAPQPQALEPQALPLGVAALYPELAAAAIAGGAEQTDALSALVHVLGQQLRLQRVRASKPAHAQGASFSLKSRSKVAKPSPPPASAAPPPASAAPPPAAAPVSSSAASAWSSAWTAAAAEEGPDLMDEDALLTEEDRATKEAVVPCGTEDGSGRKKACKNCSCGLREILENEDGTKVEVPVKSSCGSCGLGDAFRCAGCPHLGKPAFAPGEEIKLAESNFGPTVAPAAKTAAPAVTGGGGVVKLSMADMMDDF